jgi:hypothetical protein
VLNKNNNKGFKSIMDNQLPKSLIITISLIQGILLTLLYRSVENQVWPGTEPLWLVPLATFTISFPLLLLLSITKGNIRATVTFLLPYTLLLSVLGAYVGYQQEPVEYVNNWSVVAVFCFTSLIACFKALMYIQQYKSDQNISYSSLFKISWRNFIIFGECWLFVLIFWGILNLGAGLFSVLEIDFFKELLKEDWFVIPVLNLAFGFSIVVFRNIIHTVDNISTILQTLIKFLLPPLTIISLGFLATLPFTGLESLWKTGSGSLLVMWLQALTLFFVNAVYQDASHERPYKNVLHRIIFIGIAFLPIYSFISAYGLWLRIDQYGLTVDRCWAVLICFLLACFSTGYLVGILKKRDEWLEILSKVNIAMGLVVLGFMLLVNSPLLNFQSISASSQLSRLDSGDTNIDTFDYQYFGSSLGRQGYLKLQDLKKGLEATHPKTVILIDRMYTNTEYKPQEKISAVEFEKLVTFWPNKTDFPTDLIETIFDKETENTWSQYKKNNYYFLSVDLNNDGEEEFVIIIEDNNSTTGQLWQLEENKWESTYMNLENPDKNRYLKEMIINNDIKTKESKWQDLQIGKLIFKVSK